MASDDGFAYEEVPVHESSVSSGKLTRTTQ